MKTDGFELNYQSEGTVFKHYKWEIFLTNIKGNNLSKPLFVNLGGEHVSNLPSTDIQYPDIMLELNNLLSRYNAELLEVVCIPSKSHIKESNHSCKGVCVFSIDEVNHIANILKNKSGVITIDTFDPNINEIKDFQSMRLENQILEINHNLIDYTTKNQKCVYRSFKTAACILNDIIQNSDDKYDARSRVLELLSYAIDSNNGLTNSQGVEKMLIECSKMNTTDRKEFENLFKFVTGISFRNYLTRCKSNIRILEEEMIDDK